jgi:hypothetical protein
MIEMQQQKVADEMKAYTSSDPYTRKKTFRYLCDALSQLCLLNAFSIQDGCHY